MMEEKKYTPAFLRRRKFLALAPLVFIPIVTVVVWAVDNLSKEDKQAAEVTGQHGLNKEVPQARVKDDKGNDKLAFYDQAQLDSIKRRERMGSEGVLASGLPDSANGLVGTRDTNVERVDQKLKELNRVLETRHATVAESLPTPPARSLKLSENGVDRLESMMRSMKGDNEGNPEMREMNAVLDKLLRVQHPEWSRDSMRTAAQLTLAGALPVERLTGSVEIAGLDGSVPGGNRFYGLDDSTASMPVAGAMEVEVPERLVLVSGATVKLKLLQAVRVNGFILSAGSFIYGVATLTGERLMVAIHSVRSGDRILPVDLRVYDMDGLEGIYIPGAITRDVVKESADQSINSLGLGVYDPSLGGQATQAGIQLAKGLMSRKVRQVRVTVEAGYRLLLRDYSHRS